MSPPESSLDIVANNECKALVYTAMVEVGEATHTGIVQGTMERFELEGKEQDYSHLGKFAAMFARHGFATETMKPSRFSSRIVRYFEAQRLDDTLPEIGATLDWSRQHSLPIGWVLGRSIMAASSLTAKKSLALVEKALDGTAIKDLEGLYLDKASRSDRLRMMIREGIIVMDEDKNRFTIDDPNYTGRKPFDKLKFERQHIYTTLQFAKKIAPDRAWSREEILELAFFLMPRHRLNDMQLAKRLDAGILAATSISYPRDFSGAIRKVDVAHQYIKIADTHREAVIDLLERSVRLESPAARATYRDIAFDISKDTVTANKLFMKGLETSPHQKKSRKNPS